MTYVRTPPHLYKHQADAVLNQANPTSGNPYTVLNTTPNARIISIEADVTWTVQPTPLEVHVTIDGQTLTFTIANPATATAYDARLASAEAATNQTLDVLAFTPYRAFLLEGRSVNVTVETTGGTVQNLNSRVKYAKRE